MIISSLKIPIIAQIENSKKCRKIQICSVKTGSYILSTKTLLPIELRDNSVGCQDCWLDLNVIHNSIYMGWFRI